MILLKKSRSWLSFSAKMSQILKRDKQRAERVQAKIVNNEYDIEAQAKLRQKVNVQSSVQQLENEMREQIARSLKNSEGKVLQLIQRAQKGYQQHMRRPKNAEQIKQYNNLVAECQKARWQFMVHRQAVGFTIKNYELVTTLYKIPPPIV